MMTDITSALPTFLITLREGVEAALVVGIVMAYLTKAGQSRLNTWVYGGIGAGLVASALVGVLFFQAFQVIGAANPAYASVMKPLLQSLFSAVAIVLLSWMLIWMTRQSRRLKGELEGEINTALANDVQAGWGIFVLIFFAVLREGFETVIFLAAQYQEGWMPIFGAFAGLIAAVGIGILLFKLGVNINLKLFFLWMGVFLLLIVAGLVVSALSHFDAALTSLTLINPSASVCISDPGLPNHSCLLGPMLLDTQGLLPEREFPGVILHTLFGYEDQLYLAEALAYGLFLAVVGTLYFRNMTDRTPSNCGKFQKVG